MSPSPSPAVVSEDASSLADVFAAYADIVRTYREAIKAYLADGRYPEDDTIDRTALETQNGGGTPDEELKAGLYDLNRDGIANIACPV